MTTTTEDGWSVLLEYAAPPGADTIAVTDERWDSLMETVEPFAGIISTAPDRCSLRLSVSARDEVTAAVAGHDLAVKAFANVGLPEWSCIRLEALTEAELNADLARSNFPDLLGVAEMADRFGVSRQRIHTLRKRPDFPAPVVELAAGPIWLRAAAEAFLQIWDRKPGRPSMQDLLPGGAADPLRDILDPARPPGF